MVPLNGIECELIALVLREHADIMDNDAVIERKRQSDPFNLEAQCTTSVATTQMRQLSWRLEEWAL